MRWSQTTAMLSALYCSAELAEIWVSHIEFLFAAPEKAVKTHPARQTMKSPSYSYSPGPGVGGGVPPPGPAEP